MNHREAAWGLLTEFTQSESLRKHALRSRLACGRMRGNFLRDGDEELVGSDWAAA